MTGFVQTLQDSWLIAKTDRRVWAATAFLIGVLAVWTLTAAWRAPRLEDDAHHRHIYEEEVYVRNLVQEMTQKLDERKKAREELKQVIDRAKSDIDADKQKTDWNVTTLIDKLNAMTMRVDHISRQISDRKIDDAKLQQKLDASKKKHHAVRLDRSDL